MSRYVGQYGRHDQLQAESVWKKMDINKKNLWKIACKTLLGFIIAAMLVAVLWFLKTLE